MGYDNDGIGCREELLNYLENINPVKISAYLRECAKLVEIREDYEINQIMALIEKEEGNDINNIYEDQKEYMRLLEEDVEVRDQLIKMIKYLKENGDEEERIETIHTLASIMNITVFRGFSDNKKDLWSDIRAEIANKMIGLSVRDFLCVIEITMWNPEILLIEEYIQVFIEKISEMSEAEFIRYLYDTSNNTVLKNERIIQAENIKLKKVSTELAPIYLRICGDTETELKMLENPRPFDIVEILINVSNFRSEEIKSRVCQLARQLTPEQVVKYLVLTKNMLTKCEELEEILMQKIEDLSEKELDILLVEYEATFKTKIQKKIAECAQERGNIKDKVDQAKYILKRDIYRDKDIKRKIEIILESQGAVSGIEGPGYTVDWRNVADLGKDDIELRTELEETYMLHQQQTDAYEGLLKYIIELSNANDRTIFSMIETINKMAKYDIVQNEDVELIIKKTLGAIEVYVKNRILETADENVPFLSIMSFQKDGPFADAIKERIERYQEKAINKLKPVNGAPTGNSEGR